MIHIHPQKQEAATPGTGETGPLSCHSRKRAFILTGIHTCANAKERRKIVRKAWTAHQSSGIKCRFFPGSEAPQEHHDFGCLFKCDDDSPIALDRATDLIHSQYDLTGDPVLKIRGESFLHDLKGIESHASHTGHAFNELATSRVKAIKPLVTHQ